MDKKKYEAICLLFPIAVGDYFANVRDDNPGFNGVSDNALMMEFDIEFYIDDKKTGLLTDGMDLYWSPKDGWQPLEEFE